MTKGLIATVLAASIALTGMSAAPARALDSGELGRLMLGAGALIIIGRAITENNRRYRAPVTRYYDHDHYAPYRGGSNIYVKPRYKKVVPSACLRENHWGNGPRHYFGRHCLSKYMRNYASLPGFCRTIVWTNRGQQSVYSARCLRRNGWVFG